MSKDHEWKNEKFWIEVEFKGLYPPEKITKIQGAEELVKDEDFSGKKVLDNGCGTGWLGEMLQKRGANVIGIDISNTLLEEASKHIQTIKASSYKLPFDGQSFDYVVSFMVIHILDDLTKVLKEVHRVLKQNGKFYIGIVHPMAEKWNEETGLCYSDPASYNKTEERVWVFNLIDGRKFTKHYLHRPLNFYQSEFSKLFTITRKLEPKFPQEIRNNGRYASTEYLFLEMTRK
jgi:ubiquinone/menaquinone biosynthesis C-methylase UbiE